MLSEISGRRNKLGLALAGGGFRASLFHLGVLHRMAELDLLRYVEVLSTVSGGSIIGALYALLLKKHLEESDNEGKMSCEQYISIVKDLQKALVKGIQKNLRTRLFLNPFGILRVITTPQSLGKRMARLYERYLYKDVVKAIERPGWWQNTFRPGRMKLENIRINPNREPIKSGIEGYNQKCLEEALKKKPNSIDTPGPAVATKLVLNATSLNSGARFFFSSSEIGDWFLGYFRNDDEELEILEKRKKLIEDISKEKLNEHIKSGVENFSVGKLSYCKSDLSFLSFALWWRGYEEAKAVGPDNKTPKPDETSCWNKLFENGDNFPGLLPEAEMGRLRLAKIHAWYIRYGQKKGITGGLKESEHLNYFWKHLKGIDSNQVENLQKLTEDDDELRNILLDFVLELYYFRSAARMSPRIKRDWEKLSVGEAVGASACFPPVFPPLQVLGFYDDVHVSRLGLTDGGVFDNIGWIALLDEECDHIIASDTSGLFGLKERVSAGRLSMMARITSILMADVAWNQADRLQEKKQFTKQINQHIASPGTPSPDFKEFLAGHGLNGLAYFHINSPPAEILEGEPQGLTLQLDRTDLASIRTDLDGFGMVEIAALVNHGYITADRTLRRELKKTPYCNEKFWKETPSLPYPQLNSGKRVKKIIKVGKYRFGRALMLGAPFTWASTLAIAAGIIYFIIKYWNVKISVHQILTWLAGKAVNLIESSISWFGSAWTQQPYSLNTALLILFFTVSVWIGLRWIIGFNLVEYLQRKNLLSWARRSAWIAKWIRGSSANLLWPIGGSPAIIALVSCVFSFISNICFYLPFKKKTSDISS